MSLAADLSGVCTLAASRLGLTGVALHLMTAAEVVGVAASSDDRAARLGEVAFLTGEGPCLDALQLRRPVLVDDLASVAMRWESTAP